MRKICYLLVLIMAIPAITNAHTELTSSNPATGQVVKESLQEILLTFGEEIESLSSMTVEKEGQDIPLARVTPKDNQMTGTISEPLENGSYTVKWRIVGEDGHSITGQIPFTIQMEEETKK